ncbi:hypothetical protein IAD21_00540 [Abditibacteriota bacterium]|nr:hypothetical protein IAD21_00540 [Abditibacteriota bacterium]
MPYFPSGPSVSGGGNSEVLAAIAALAADVASIQAHFDAVLEPEEPAVILPVHPEPGQATVRVYCFSTETGLPLNNAVVSISLKDKRVLAIAGRFYDNHTLEGRTNSEGFVDFGLWTQDTLENADRKPEYEVMAPGVPKYTIRVPDEGGLAADLKYPPST